jgi:ParB/RepB/Spo0J family partition protein
MEIRTLPISEIVFTGNVRNVDPDDPGILELAASLDANGQEVEIRVYQVGSTYFLKAGHRRIVAALRLGWDEIRAVIEPTPNNEADLLISQYNENDQREAMSYLEKANVYARLKELGYTQTNIAQRFNRSDADISLALATLRADPKLQDAVEKGIITPSAVEPLLSQPIEVQADLADAAIAAKTVRKVRSVVQTYKQQQELFEVEAKEAAPVAEDVDPLEFLALDELNLAVDHLSNVQQTGIHHPTLRRKARPTVEQLVRIAANLKELLDGKTWDDTKDLV